MDIKGKKAIVLPGAEETAERYIGQTVEILEDSSLPWVRAEDGEEFLVDLSSEIGIIETKETMNSTTSYKLLKDLPGVKAGALLKLEGEDWTFTEDDSENPYWFTQEEIDKNPDWFELVEKPLKPGDYIVITKGHKNWASDMNEYVGRTFRVTRVFAHDGNRVDMAGMDAWTWRESEGHFRRATPEEAKAAEAGELQKLAIDGYVPTFDAQGVHYGCQTISKATLEGILALDKGLGTSHVNLEIVGVKINRSSRVEPISRIQQILDGLRIQGEVFGYTINLPREQQIIRIGCEDEDHRFSINELEQIVAAYKSL